MQRTKKVRFPSSLSSLSPESLEPSSVCTSGSLGAGSLGKLAVLGKQNSVPADNRHDVNQEMLN